MSRAGYKSAIMFMLVAALAATTARAQTTLSNEGLFRRCYAHITQLQPKLSDPLLAQVIAGSKTPIQACQEVFDSALLTASGGTMLADTSNAVSKSILRTFHELHRSWAREQKLFTDLSDIGIFEISTGSEPWYEDSPYGAYVTRALLSPGFDVDSVTSGTDFLQPVRTNMSPPHVYGPVPRNLPDDVRDWRLGANHPFAPQGELLGIRAVNLMPLAVATPTRYTALYELPDFPNLAATPNATQSISNINFTTVDQVNGPLTVVDQFAVRIQGQLNITTAGNYTLYLDCDDGCSLILDGERVVFVPYGGQVSSGAKPLSAGSHSVVVEYRQYNNNARLIMRWSGPSFLYQVVPVSAFSGLQAQYWSDYLPLPTEITGNEGGGFLGNHNYFLTTFMQPSSTFKPDGALKTNRTWGRALFSDALCREIPVVREADVTAFVDAASPVPFRQYAACTACHASLDGGVSGVIRNVRWNILDNIDQDPPLPDLYGIMGIHRFLPSLNENQEWPADSGSDAFRNDYSKRAPFGRLYFRNLHGNLVNQEVRSIEELGAAIRSQDDYYACFAKRYYKYFMGIDVELGDPGRAQAPTLNPAEAHHLAKVLELGDRLKTSKSLRQLIFDIIGSDEYRMSDYGVSYAGSPGGGGEAQQ